MDTVLAVAQVGASALLGVLWASAIYILRSFWSVAAIFLLGLVLAAIEYLVIGELKVAIKLLGLTALSIVAGLGMTAFDTVPEHYKELVLWCLVATMALVSIATMGLTRGLAL